MTADREELVAEVAGVLAEHVDRRLVWPACSCGWSRQDLDTSKDHRQHRAHLADALADLLAAREQQVRAEAIWEYRDALAGNESAENWCTRDAYLHDLVDWATYIEEGDA